MCECGECDDFPKSCHPCGHSECEYADTCLHKGEEPNMSEETNPNPTTHCYSCEMGIAHLCGNDDATWNA